MLGVHGADETQIVDDGCGVRQSIGDVHPRMSVLVEFEGRRQQNVVIARLMDFDTIGVGLTGALGWARLARAVQAARWALGPRGRRLRTAPSAVPRRHETGSFPGMRAEELIPGFRPENELERRVTRAYNESWRRGPSCSAVAG